MAVQLLQAFEEMWWPSTQETFTCKLYIPLLDDCFLHFGCLSQLPNSCLIHIFSPKSVSVVVQCLKSSNGSKSTVYLWNRGWTIFFTKRKGKLTRQRTRKAALCNEEHLNKRTRRRRFSHRSTKKMLQICFYTYTYSFTGSYWNRAECVILLLQSIFLLLGWATDFLPRLADQLSSSSSA